MELTKEQAIKLNQTKFWEEMEPHQICAFQLFTPRLCMPFDVFHKAVEECLDRPVYTHEFGLSYDGLCKEFLGEKEKPSFQEILDLIPEKKE